MPTEPKKLLSHVLIAPLKDILTEVAKGVAEAQLALDHQALELTKEIYSNTELKDLRDAGIEPTWYQIPEVTTSLKVAISLHSKEEDSNKGRRLKIYDRLRVMPFNAVYQNSFDYDYNGASEIKFRIVPIPPPIDSMYTIVPNLMGKTIVEVRKILGEAKLVVGEIREKESQVPSEIVIEQNPDASSKVRIGENVEVTISKHQ